MLLQGDSNGSRGLSPPSPLTLTTAYLSCEHHRGTSSFLTFEIFVFSCLHNIVVAYAIFIMIYLTVFQLYAVHLYLSVSRSMDGGPAFSIRENLVPRFPVPRFQRPHSESDGGLKLTFVMHTCTVPGMYGLHTGELPLA